MSRVVIIGGSGHVGTYLVPRLVEAGSRGRQRQPRRARALQPACGVEVGADGQGRPRRRGEGRHVRQDDRRAEAGHRHRHDLLHAGQRKTSGRGAARQRPAFPALRHDLGARTERRPCRHVESQPRTPFGEYGVQKAAIEAFLLDEARRNGFPATICHPGHIVGPGWAPLNPAGHFNPRVFPTLARGEELALPNFGMETVHHVHADDVAQMFMRAIANWSAPSARHSTPCRRRRSACAAMPRRWRAGSGTSRS